MLLQGMTHHQVNRHPFTTGMIILVLGPLLLAAVLLYVTVHVIYGLLSFAVAVGRRAHELRREQ